MAWGRKARALGKKVILQPGQHLAGRPKPSVTAVKRRATVLPGQTLVTLRVEKPSELPWYVAQLEGPDRFEEGELCVTTMKQFVVYDDKAGAYVNSANSATNVIEAGTFAVCLGQTVRQFRSSVKWVDKGRPELVTVGRVRFLIDGRVVEPTKLKFFKPVVK